MRPTKPIIRIISSILVITFLTLDISWAYPSMPGERSTLAIDSRMQPETMTGEASAAKSSMHNLAGMAGTILSIANALLKDRIPEKYLPGVVSAELGTRIPEPVRLSGARYSTSGAVLIPIADSAGRVEKVIQVAPKDSPAAKAMVGDPLNISDRYEVRVASSETRARIPAVVPEEVLPAETTIRESSSGAAPSQPSTITVERKRPAERWIKNELLIKASLTMLSLASSTLALSFLMGFAPVIAIAVTLGTSLLFLPLSKRIDISSYAASAGIITLSIASRVLPSHAFYTLSQSLCWIGALGLMAAANLFFKKAGTLSARYALNSFFVSSTVLTSLFLINFGSIPQYLIGIAVGIIAGAWTHISISPYSKEGPNARMTKSISRGYMAFLAWQLGATVFNLFNQASLVYTASFLSVMALLWTALNFGAYVAAIAGRRVVEIPDDSKRDFLKASVFAGAALVLGLVGEGGLYTKDERKREAIISQIDDTLAGMECRKFALKDGTIRVKRKSDNDRRRMLEIILSIAGRKDNSHGFSKRYSAEKRAKRSRDLLGVAAGAIRPDSVPQTIVSISNDSTAGFKAAHPAGSIYRGYQYTDVDISDGSVRMDYREIQAAADSLGIDASWIMAIQLIETDRFEGLTVGTSGEKGLSQMMDGTGIDVWTGVLGRNDRYSPFNRNSAVWLTAGYLKQLYNTFTKDYGLSETDARLAAFATYNLGPGFMGEAFALSGEKELEKVMHKALTTLKDDPSKLKLRYKLLIAREYARRAERNRKVLELLNELADKNQPSKEPTYARKPHGGENVLPRRDFFNVLSGGALRSISTAIPGRASTSGGAVETNGAQLTASQTESLRRIDRLDELGVGIIFSEPGTGGYFKGNSGISIVEARTQVIMGDTEIVEDAEGEIFWRKIASGGELRASSSGTSAEPRRSTSGSEIEDASQNDTSPIPSEQDYGAAEDMRNIYSRILAAKVNRTANEALWRGLFNFQSLRFGKTDIGQGDLSELSLLIKKLHDPDFANQFTRHIRMIYDFLIQRVDEDSRQDLTQGRDALLKAFFDRLPVGELHIREVRRFKTLGHGQHQRASQYDQGDLSYAVLRNTKDHEHEIRFDAQEDIFGRVNPLGKRIDLPFLLKVVPVPNESQVTDELLVEQRFPDGQTLQDIDTRHWTKHQKALFALSLARTMKYLAERGVVHRDIKPLNIWVPAILTRKGDWDAPDIEQHPPIVFDFDVSVLLNAGGRYQKIIEQDESQHYVVGTPGWSNLPRSYFLSDDKHDYDSLNPRKDLFSYGVVLSWLFDGAVHRYLEGGTAEIIRWRVLGQLAGEKTPEKRRREISRILESSILIDQDVKLILLELIRPGLYDISLNWDGVVDSLEELSALWTSPEKDAVQENSATQVRASSSPSTQPPSAALLGASAEPPVVSEAEPRRSTSGEKAPDTGRETSVYAGTDIGGTKVALGLVDKDGKPLTEPVVFPTNHDITGALEEIAGETGWALEGIGASWDSLTASGLGYPGDIDGDGNIFSCTVLPGTDGFKLSASFRDVLQRYAGRNIPVIVAPDVDIAAFGEALYGAGIGRPRFVYTTVSTGVGAAAYEDGKIEKRFFEMEVFPEPKFPKMNVQDLSSGTAMAAAAKERLAGGAESIILGSVTTGKIRDITAVDVGKALKRRDYLALELVRNAGRYLGDMVVYVYEKHGFDVFIFGGGVMRIGEPLLNAIRERVLEKIAHFDPANIIASPLDVERGILGAAAIVRAQAGITGRTSASGALAGSVPFQAKLRDGAETGGVFQSDMSTAPPNVPTAAKVETKVFAGEGIEGVARKIEIGIRGVYASSDIAQYRTILRLLPPIIILLVPLSAFYSLSLVSSDWMIVPAITIESTLARYRLLPKFQNPFSILDKSVSYLFGLVKLLPDLQNAGDGPKSAVPLQGLAASGTSLEKGAIPECDTPQRRASTSGADAETSELFRLVEGYVNNNRTRLVNAANRLAEFMAAQVRGVSAEAAPKIDESAPTAEVRAAIEKVVSDVEKAKANGAAIPAERLKDAEEIRKNLEQLEADSIVASVITRARSAKREDQKLIIGLETDWIPGYNEKGNLQKNAINPLVKEIDSLGEALQSMGLDNVMIIHHPSEELADALLNEASKTKTELTNVIVLASKASITSDKFNLLKSAPGKKKAFMAGIDTSEIEKWYAENSDSVDQPDLELMKMLAIALELALGKEPPNIPLVFSYDKNLRVVIFLPKAEPVNYEELKNRYHAQKQALQAA